MKLLLQPILILSLLLSPAVLAGTGMHFASLKKLPDSGSLALPVASDGVLPQSLPQGVRNKLKRAMRAAGFEGEAGAVLPVYSNGPYEVLTLVGLGDKTLDAKALENYGGTVAGFNKAHPAKRFHVLAPKAPAVSNPAAHVALGVALGNYRFDKYKSVDDSKPAPAQTRFVVHSKSPGKAKSAWEDQWEPVANAVIFARDLVSEPANEIYPQSFVTRTKEAFSDLPSVGIDVLDVKAMEKLGMGSLLGVGMGSDRPPRLLVVRYRGSGSGEMPIAFVGKGVTFDSGGISIKGSKGMWKMKFDMAGAASAVGTVLALAGREAGVNAVAIAALVENMPSGVAQRPGDIRSTMSGKTIEVLNTDAEGRLILADAVWYAQEEFKPRAMIDIATLTGSIVGALGNTYAGVFSRHDELAAQLLTAGDSSGELLWRMPLHEDFAKAIKSDIADVKNVVEGGRGGASLGAEVIGAFVKSDTVWGHLDIAGRAWNTADAATVPKGATGFGIRLLNQWVADNYE